MEGPLPCNNFLPPQQSRYQDMTSGFTTHESSCGRKQKRTLNIPGSPWEISDIYSEWQMSAILMNTPKIKFFGVRFLRIALKSQYSLAGVVLRSPDPWTKRDLCHLEWDTLFLGKYLKLIKENLTILKKYSAPTGSQRSWKVLGVATVSLWGILLLVRGKCGVG